MNKPRLRLIFAVVMLVVSLAALAWSFLPGARIVRRQKIQPTEMQLPTPAGFHLSGRLVAELEFTAQPVCPIYGADRFVLLI